VFVDDSGSVIGLVTSRAEPPASVERTPDTYPVAGTTPRDALDTANALHFAIPGDFVWDVAAQITDKGVVVKPWLGLPRGDDIPENELSRDGVGGGMKITFFEDGSPARERGLRYNDVIVAIDKDNVTSYNDFVAALRRHRPGDEIDITYIRDSEISEQLVTVGGKPEVP
jgi:S1-C subfamily serine protease